MVVQVCLRTDVGRCREHNEDAVGEALAPSGARLVAIADGMGGFEAGEEASEAAVQALITRWVEDHGAAVKPRVLERLIADAHRAVLRRAAELGLQEPSGTTLVTLVLHDGEALIGHVGDSRAYLLRDGMLKQLTRDHTEAQALVDAGALPAEAMETHPLSHILTHCLGVDARLQVSTGPRLEVRPRDVFLLCSDGLSGVVPGSLIRDVVSYFSLDEAGARLIEAANGLGAPDNVSVALVRIGDETSPLEVAPEDFCWPRELQRARGSARLGCWMLLLAVVVGALMVGWLGG